jgi:hypothetical protein
VARGGFSRGVSSVAVDFVPPFLPLTFQLPQAFPVSNPRNRCFRWKSVQERTLTLDQCSLRALHSAFAARTFNAGAQRLSVEIGP